ncbi:MAG: hypothetical protein ACKO5A_05045 [Actinomycetota bacterium]
MKVPLVVIAPDMGSLHLEDIGAVGSIAVARKYAPESVGVR